MVQKTVGFGYSHQKKKKGWKWFLFILIAIIIVAVRWRIKYSPSDLVFEWEKVSIVKWDTITKFYNTLLDDNQTFWMKLAITVQNLSKEKLKFKIILADSP